MKGFMKNGGLRILISVILSIITIPCLVYYISKYYIEKSLSFENQLIIMVTLFTTLLIFAILLGVYNAFITLKLQEDNLELKKENKELHNLIIDLDAKVEKHHYDNLECHNSTKELILDMEVE